MISWECALTPEEKPEPSQVTPGLRENFRPHISFIGQAQMGVNPPKKCSENPEGTWVPSSFLLLPAFGHPWEWPF